MNLGPHADVIVAAYAVTLFAVAALVAWAVLDYSAQRRILGDLEERGVTLHAAAAGVPQRRAYTYVDERGERTITVLGPRLLPSGDDGSLPWEELSRCEAVYFVSGDVAAVRAARRSRVLVAATRDLATLRQAGEEVDVLVGSGEDAGERFGPGDLEPPPRTVVTTSGSLGGCRRGTITVPLGRYSNT